MTTPESGALLSRGLPSGCEETMSRPPFSRTYWYFIHSPVGIARLWTITPTFASRACAIEADKILLTPFRDITDIRDACVLGGRQGGQCLTRHRTACGGIHERTKVEHMVISHKIQAR